MGENGALFYSRLSCDALSTADIIVDMIFDVSIVKQEIWREANVTRGYKLTIMCVEGFSDLFME